MKPYIFACIFCCSVASAGEISLLLPRASVEKSAEIDALYAEQRDFMRADSSGFYWPAMATDYDCFATSKNNITALLDCMYNEKYARFLMDIHKSTCNERGGFAKKIIELFSGPYRGYKIPLENYEKVIFCAIFVERWRFENARIASAAWKKNPKTAMSWTDIEQQSVKTWLELKEACKKILVFDHPSWQIFAQAMGKNKNNPWNVGAIHASEWLLMVDSSAALTDEMNAALQQKERERREQERKKYSDAAKNKRDANAARARENREINRLLNQ